MANDKGTGHKTPDFTPKDNEKDAAAAQKKVESLKEKQADLVAQLEEVRSEISVESAKARTAVKPGFSNSPSVKEQTKANEATQAENAKTSVATKK